MIAKEVAKVLTIKKNKERAKEGYRVKQGWLLLLISCGLFRICLTKLEGNSVEETVEGVIFLSRRERTTKEEDWP